MLAFGQDGDGKIGRGSGGTRQLGTRSRVPQPQEVDCHSPRREKELRKEEGRRMPNFGMTLELLSGNQDHTAQISSCRVLGKTLDVVTGGLHNDIRAPPPDRHVCRLGAQSGSIRRAELVAHASALLAQQDSKRPRKPHEQKRRVRAVAHPEQTRHGRTLLQDCPEQGASKRGPPDGRSWAPGPLDFAEHSLRAELKALSPSNSETLI